MDLAEKEEIYDSTWAQEERKRLESRQIPSHVLESTRRPLRKWNFWTAPVPGRNLHRETM